MITMISHNKDFMIMRYALIVIAYIVQVAVTNAQKVTVSPNVNIRSDASYHLLGTVDERILLFRDQNGTMLVNVYDNDLVLKSERQVNLLSDQSFLYNFTSSDTTFNVIYGYVDEEDHVVQMDVFSAEANIVDSLEVFRFEKERRGLSFKSVISENGRVLALYRFVEDNLLRLIVIDTRSNRVLTNNEYLASNYDLESDLVDIQVSDDGYFLMLQDVNAVRSKRSNHYINILTIQPNAKKINENILSMAGYVTSDIQLFIDNHNKEKGVIALYDEKKSSRSVGYAWYKGDINGYGEAKLELELYDDLVLYEINGNQRSNHIENFVISDILVKKDGMPIMMLEMSLDVQRSPTGNTTRTARTSFNRSNRFVQWSDHYREDIIVISLDKEGDQEWHQMFYKRQLSQNDQAMYSSFFSFVTPSRVRVLFNDEIRENSNVSEYVFDGLGNHKRNSVLSTEYQKLRLRFKDAVQLSGSEVIVPSQKEYTLNLVKIKYD